MTGVNSWSVTIHSLLKLPKVGKVFEGEHVLCITSWVVLSLLLCLFPSHFSIIIDSLNSDAIPLRTLKLSHSYHCYVVV